MMIDYAQDMIDKQTHHSPMKYQANKANIKAVQEKKCRYQVNRDYR